MATDILVPALGESVSEATVAQWLKKPGEAVQVDDPLVELETDKVTLEVNATAAGVLSEVLAGEGDNVEVGALLGRIAEGGAATAAPSTASAAPKTPAPKTPAPAAPTEAKPAAATPAATAAPDSLSPAVRKLIEDNRFDPGQIQGTGKDGRLLKEDVLRALEVKPTAGVAAGAAAPPSSPGAQARGKSVV